MELVINIMLTDESKAGDGLYLEIKHCLHRPFEQAGGVLFG